MKEKIGNEFFFKSGNKCSKIKIWKKN